MAAIQKAKAPVNLKELSRFIRQIKWHNRFLKYLSHVCVPLTKLNKKEVKYVWTEEHEKAFRLLKKMLQVAPVRVSSNVHLSCNPPIFRVPNVVRPPYEEKP